VLPQLQPADLLVSEGQDVGFPAHPLRRTGSFRRFTQLVAVPHDAVDCSLGIRTHDALPGEDLLTAELDFARCEDGPFDLEILILVEMRLFGALRACLVVAGADIPVLFIHFLHVLPAESGMPVLFFINILQELV
jgi:hypothetical protein